MRGLILTAALVGALSAPALADNYPVSGRWGQSTSTQKGAIDCSGKRVITFNGNQRRDSGGGVHAFRNLSVTPAGQDRYDVIDVFSNGQVNNGRVLYTLVESDADHIALQMQMGGRCRCSAANNPAANHLGARDDLALAAMHRRDGAETTGLSPQQE